MELVFRNWTFYKRSSQLQFFKTLTDYILQWYFKCLGYGIGGYGGYNGYNNGGLYNNYNNYGGKRQ